MGRNRRFQLGEIVRKFSTHAWSQLYVVVEFRPEDGKRYRVIPLDYKKRRRGDAVWMDSFALQAYGQHSGTASIKTYRANEAMPERGCSCECCVHEKYDASSFTNWGNWRGSPDD